MQSDNWVTIAVCILILFWSFSDVLPIHTENVLEIKCKIDDGFDANHHCNHADKVGASFNIRINTWTQKVLFDVTRPDGNWFEGASILDNCKVVDAANWECTKEDKLGTTGLTSETGMIKGQFYRSYVGGIGPNFYSSGISGWRYWVVYLGIMSASQAIKF